MRQQYFEARPLPGRREDGRTARARRRALATIGIFFTASCAAYAQTSTTFEAEGGTVTGAVKVSSAAASGGQYVDYNAASQTIEVANINASAAGSRTMTIRYANGRENNWTSGIDVYVNGTLAGTFWDTNTGGWTNWASGSFNVSLNAGANTIRLVSKYDHSPNIDYIALPGVTAGTGGGGTNPPPTGSGSIVYEYWSNVSGTAVSQVPTGTAPSGTITLNSLEAPVNRGDNFGSRIRGYVTAPQTGSYTFWVSSDDSSELRLSPSDQPSGATVIAGVNGWTNSREWGKYASQKSAAVSLTAGQRYYVEVLHKEGGGGDNVAVGWAKPGQATTAPSEVVPGSALSPFEGTGPTNPPPGGDDPTKNLMGINIHNPSDYSDDRLFADAMKTARSYELTGGGAAPTDANGWPASDFRVVVWHGIGQMNGTYRLRFTGQASVAAGWASTSLSAVTYNSSTNTSEATLVYNNTDGAGLQLTFTNTKRTGASATGTGVTNVQLMKPTAPGSTTSYAYGTLFGTPIQTLINKFRAIRFMDFTATNSNIQVNWSDRAKPTDASQNRNPGGYGWQGRGGAWEYAVALANQTNKDMWICVPARASNDYVTKLAQLIRYGSDGVNPYTSAQASPVWAPLNSNLKLYVEYSNELWNTAGAFQQSFHNKDLAVAEVNAAGTDPLEYDGLVDSGGWQYAWRRIGKRGVQVSNLFRGVFGDSAMMSRVRPVLMSQLGYAGGPLATAINFLEDYYNNPAYQATPRPASYYFYGAGGSAYYNPDNDSDTLDLNNIWNSETFNPVNWQGPVKDDIDYAASFGLKRIAYEGGPSMDALGHSEAVKAAARDDARMKTEVLEHHNLWSQYGGELLTYFTSTGGFEWGFTASVFNLNTPKLQAIDDLNVASRAAVTYGSLLPASVAGNAFSKTNVGWKNPGTGSLTMRGGDNVRWAGYVMRAPSAASYSVRVNYSASNSGVLRVFFDGVLVGTVNVSAGASNVTSAAFPVAVQPGIHAVRVQCTAGPVTLNSVSVQ